MYTLYFGRGSCALASHIALEHVGADYRAVRLDLAANEQRSLEFLRLNPKGRVPALVTPRGVLSETPAILGFIARSFPAARLAPLEEPYELARLESFNSYLCSTVHVAHAHGRRGKRWADDPAAIAEMKRKVPETMSACFETIEHDLLEGPWVFGEHYTVSDMYLFTISGWLESDGVDIRKFPKVHAHYERMLADPVVNRVLEAENAN